MLWDPDIIITCTCYLFGGYLNFLLLDKLSAACKYSSRFIRPGVLYMYTWSSDLPRMDRRLVGMQVGLAGMDGDFIG